MEARKITIVETKNQRKTVIMSTATTLGELKADLRTNGIDYTNMAFFEGTARVELRADSSILPHDVPYKGQLTNELVFMLTNTNKKIKSGSSLEMSRSEAYDIIRSMGLQNTCEKELGRNFSRCKTSDLITLIHKYRESGTNETVLPNGNDKCANNGVNKAFILLVELLCDAGVLTYNDQEELFGMLDNSKELLKDSSKKNKSTLESSYTDDDINEMLQDFYSE